LTPRAVSFSVWLSDGDDEMIDTKPARHIRHHGLMIDASFRKDGTVEYYVVEKGHGRFYSLEVAKEIAEHRAAVRAGRA